MEAILRDELLLRLKGYTMSRPVYRLLIKAVEQSTTPQGVVPRLRSLAKASSTIGLQEEVESWIELIECVVDCDVELEDDATDFTVKEQVEAAYENMEYFRELWAYTTHAISLGAWYSQYDNFSDELNLAIAREVNAARVCHDRLFGVDARLCMSRAARMACEAIYHYQDAAELEYVD